MRLSRLEEPSILIIALRLVVKSLHPRGDMITFPVPAAVYRIQMKGVNMPKDAVETKKKQLDQLFERRQEKLDIDELYKDFVMTHSTIVKNGHTAT